MALGDICIFTKGEYVTKKDLNPGNVPVILGGKEPAYYADRCNHEGEAIVLSRSGASAGFVSYWNEPIFVTDGFVLDARNNHSIRYIYHALKNIQVNLNQMKRGSGVPHIRGDMVAKIPIPVPPLSVQREIARILDKFDALTTDLTAGLPAELAARRKQYEYYRDKLLMFPKV